MESNETTPQEELLRILDNIKIGGMWQPAHSGLTFVRDGESKLTLMMQDNTAHSSGLRIMYRKVITDVGWSLDETPCQLIDVENLSLQEKEFNELKRRQELAQSWECKCQLKLSAFPLEDAKWLHEGQEEMRLPTGDIEMVEKWAVVIDCPVCDEKIRMEPYDFGLLAGDELYMEYKNDNMIYTALGRMEIIQRIDRKESETMIMLGTFCPFFGDLLPPHLRGSIVSYKEATGGEEE
jgi:hypothetical protein|tara:strand:+ start:669 stop:1379 length:711 start_codon:yes stop_codon:yes gene_type:complete